MKKAIVSVLALGPVAALAQAPNLTYASSFLTQVKSLVNLALPLVVGLALLGFFWGLAKFILQGGEDKEKGKNMMVYGVIALFVMVSVWGLVGFLGRVSGVDQNTAAPTITVPTVNTI